MKIRENQVLVGGIASAIALAAASPPSFAGTLHNGWKYIIDVGDYSFEYNRWNDAIDAGYDNLGGELGTVVVGEDIYEINDTIYKIYERVKLVLLSMDMEPVYEVLPISGITAILDFPCGIDTDNPFIAPVGVIGLDLFQPGDKLIFIEFEELLNELPIDDIIEIPDNDKAEPTNSYVNWVSNTPVVDVRMTQVPEPSAGLGLFTLAGLEIVARARRRKSSH